MVDSVQIYHSSIRPQGILNLDQPCFYEEFFELPGYAYHTLDVYNKINERYIYYMDRYTGHWSKLLEHIQENGIVYPAIINTGLPKFKKLSEVPAALRTTNSRYWMVCEQHGGMKILAAAKLGIKVPIIVNDYVGMFDGEDTMTMRELANSCQGLKNIFLNPATGIRVQDYPRIHLDIDNSEYLHCKFEAISRVIEEYQSWDIEPSIGKTINTLQRIEYEPTNN